MKVALQDPLPSSTILKDGFWPTTRVWVAQVDQLNKEGEICEEFGEDEAYVGPLSGRLQPSFKVERDLFKGYFVAVRPAIGDSHPIWITRALFDPNCNAIKPNCVLIQYFRPASRDEGVKNFYTAWDSERGLHWKIDEIELPLWQYTDALIMAWKSLIRKDTQQCMIKIRIAQIEVINQSLAEFPLS